MDKQKQNSVVPVPHTENLKPLLEDLKEQACQTNTGLPNSENSSDGTKKETKEISTKQSQPNNTKNDGE